jgi:uncharacterized protein YbjT (DUF2867 family)
MKTIIVVAGATGNLGGRIIRELLKRNVTVRALVRPGTDAVRLENLRAPNVEVIQVDLSVEADLVKACIGATCVVSALLGLKDALVIQQGNLLAAAIKAGVPKFIPSDYSIDFTKIASGLNRNFDIHREFHSKLESSSINSTTIFNGAFMELLKDAPLIFPKINRVLYWENPEVLIDFTSIDNTAAFTAEVALDANSPAILRIAGEQISASGLVNKASKISNLKFKLLRGGSLNRLKNIIHIVKAISPKTDSPFPIWQGMQYLYCMFEGSGRLVTLDNNRYPGLEWKSIDTALTEYFNYL